MSTDFLDASWAFAQRMRHAATLDDVHREVLSASTAHGVKGFLAGLIPADQSRASVATDVLFSSWPSDWATHYVRHDYRSIDPIVRAVRQKPNLPLLLARTEPMPGDSPLRLKMIAEQQDLGLLAAYLVPVPSSTGDISVLSFTADHFDLSPVSAHLLSMIGSLALSRAKQIASRAGQGATPRITSRERDVLLWSSSGKTAWDISEILAISVHTVHQHLKSATTKLGAANRTHAVAEALRLGIIT